METTQKKPYEKFIQTIKSWIADLGANSKLFAEIAEDESVPMSARTLAAGTLLYLTLPTDLIPDKLRFLGSIDDAIVMIVNLVIIVPLIPEERLPHYNQQYEVVSKVEKYQPIMASTLGILWERLIQFAKTLRKRTFKGKTTEELVQSPELREALLDETMIAIANLNLDPETLDVEAKQLPTPEKVIGLLSNGLEEMQQKETKPNISASQAKSTLKKILLSARNQSEHKKDLSKGKLLE